MSAILQSKKREVKRFARDLMTKTQAYKLFQPFYAGIGSILMFHDVAYQTVDSSERLLANKGLEVTPEYLEQIIQYFIQNNYEFLSLDDVYERLQNPQKSNKRFICFTFDDGYLNNYTLAYPIFKKHNIPFAVYIATNMVSQQSPIWWRALEDLLLKHQSFDFTFENDHYVFETEALTDKEGAFLALRNVILGMDQSKVVSFLEALFTAYQVDIYSYNSVMMSWEQVQELSKDPLVTIGAHTMNHVALKNLPDKAMVKDELLKSKQIIESHIGKPVEHFAYPYGDIGCAGKREYDIAAEVGFKTAAMAVSGNIFPEHKDYLYSLPRIYVSGEKEEKGMLALALSGTAGALANKFKRTFLAT